MTADYYATLGVSKDAGDQEIKKAFRTKARELHPDANPDDPAAEEQFKELAEAYEVLSDPEKKSIYDRYGTIKPGQAGFGAAGWQDFAFDMSDIFGMFFGDSAGTSRRVDLSGRDVAVEIAVDLEESVSGAEKELRIDQAVACGTCSGSGAAPGSGAETCTQCGGRGSVRTTQRTILGSIMQESPCIACGGTGQVITEPCKDCGGQGRVRSQDTLSVKVPAGVEDGTTLRIPGAGEAGLRGARAGDLFVHVRVRPHKVFERIGDDLLAILPLTYAQAVLGAKLKVATLDGEAEVAIPAGTQPGERLMVRGQGIPHLRSRGRGDLYIEVTIDVPKKASREEKRLLEQMAPKAARSGRGTLVSAREPRGR
jgi:molecular chaperone DnaJ